MMNQARTICYIWLLGLLALCAAYPLQAQPAEEFREGYAQNGDVKIWYRVEGAARPQSTPLLFIHGGPGATARPFEKTIGPAIAKHRQIIYMDYRGAGRSDRPEDPAQYSFSILADDIEALRKTLGIEKWSLLGHSNGAATILTYARKYPESIKSLVLCSPLLSSTDLEMNMIHKVMHASAGQYEQARAIYQSGSGLDERFGGLLDLLDREVRASLQFYNPEDAEVLRQIQGELQQEIGRELMTPALVQGIIQNGFFEFDAYHFAGSLRMPVLVMVGRYDNEISVDNAMKFGLTVPDGYVHLFNASGHHPYLEETGVMSDQLLGFLAEHADHYDDKSTGD